MNNRFGISENSYKLILSVLKNSPEVECSIIFGSRAKGNFKHGSDIDIALKGDKITPKTAMDISSTLNERISVPYSFDVIAYDFIDNTDLKEHIDRVLAWYSITKSR